MGEETNLTGRVGREEREGEREREIGWMDGWR